MREFIFARSSTQLKYSSIFCTFFTNAHRTCVSVCVWRNILPYAKIPSIIPFDKTCFFQLVIHCVLHLLLPLPELFLLLLLYILSTILSTKKNEMMIFFFVCLSSSSLLLLWWISWKQREFL